MRKILAVLLGFAAVAAIAQSVPRSSETLEVSIVNVDVVVTDRQGNRVRGLKREDFEILENKVPQPVSNFAEYASAARTPDAAAPSATAAAPEASSRDKRHVLVFFEKMQMPGFAADGIGDALKQLARDAVGPGDKLSVVIWNRHKIRHFEFTSDPAAIQHALNEIVNDLKKVELDEAQLALSQSADEQRFLQEAEAASAGRGSEVGAMTTANLESTLYLQREYNLMLRRVAAINSAITTMAGIDGKKMLILATRRLGEVAGADAIYGSGATIIPQHLRITYGTDALMRSIIENANASGVTIYPLYPPGVQLLGSIPTVADQLILQNETFSHERIAKQTGGISAAGPKNVADLLPRVASDATDYYSLAYRAASTGTDRSRDIVVRTRNPEYVVRARTQVVEKSDDTRMRDRLRATLFQPDPESQIDIVAKALVKKKGARRSTVPVEVKIPIGQLTMLSERGNKESGKFSVYVAAATELNELSDVTKKTQPFDVPRAQLAKARASHFTYELDVKIDNRSKYIAVGVFDEIGQTYGLQRIDLKGVE